jgi:hypothetical protein
MQRDAQRSNRSEDAQLRGEQSIQAWEAQYPETWILLEITAEDEGEPMRGILIATADDPNEVQAVWKSYRNSGVLTMLTYGCRREPHLEVVVSATSLGVFSSLHLQGGQFVL